MSEEKKICRLTPTLFENLPPEIIYTILYKIAMTFIRLDNKQLTYRSYVKDPWPSTKEEISLSLQAILQTNRQMRSEFRSIGSNDFRQFRMKLIGDIADKLFKTEEEMGMTAPNVIPHSIQEMKADARLNMTTMSRYSRNLASIHNEELKEFLMSHCMNLALMRAGVTVQDLSFMDEMEKITTTVYVLQGVETWAMEHFKCGLWSFIEEDSSRSAQYKVRESVRVELLRIEELEGYECRFGVPEAWNFDGVTTTERWFHDVPFSQFTSFNQPIGAW